MCVPEQPPCIRSTRSSIVSRVPTAPSSSFIEYSTWFGCMHEKVPSVKSGPLPSSNINVVACLVENSTVHDPASRRSEWTAPMRTVEHGAASGRRQRGADGRDDGRSAQLLCTPTARPCPSPSTRLHDRRRSQNAANRMASTAQCRAMRRPQPQQTAGHENRCMTRQRVHRDRHSASRAP